MSQLTRTNIPDRRPPEAVALFNADALEAVYDAGRRELAERFANQDKTRKAAIEELMAWEDEREAVADLIAEGFPHPGGGSRVVWEDCLPVADAILAAGFTRRPIPSRERLIGAIAGSECDWRDATPESIADAVLALFATPGGDS